jgi:hypothetical protein
MARHLNAPLSSFITARIPIAPDANTDPTMLFKMAMVALEAITSVGGNDTGVLVNDIQDTVQLVPGESWCMATVQSALRYVELITGKISAIAAGGLCTAVFAQSVPNQVTTPQVGDIIVFQHGAGPSGHTEIVTGLGDGTFVFAAGGNTTPGAGYTGAAGVFHKMRTTTAPIGDMTILGFLRPYL